MPFRWRLRQILEQHEITPYRFAEESGVSQTTIYKITTGELRTLNGQVLDRTMGALERLTGKRFEIGDIVERVWGE